MSIAPRLQCMYYGFMFNYMIVLFKANLNKASSYIMVGIIVMIL